jgi:predicted GH43/DUF377 family glycosyl hydrolase
MSNPAARATLLLAGLIVGCTIITDFKSDLLLEQTEERCSDRVDNDGNGLTDCADPSCRVFDFCHESSEARCTDGIDNDADGLVDCKDPECCDVAACAREPACGEHTAAACTDGTDNDNNGLTDCADFSCALPVCCQRLVPLVSDTFSSFASGCSPPDCATLLEGCCLSPPALCNVFDAQRWIAWGVPSPRILAGAFTPNQPCPACNASGIISVVDAEFSPDLHLELDVDLRGDGAASISVGLVEQAIVPQTSKACGGVDAPFPLLAGVNVVGPQIDAVVGGLVRSTVAGKIGQQRLSLDVTAAGSLRFLVDDQLFHEAQIKTSQPYPRVRVLVQGHSAVATVDNLLLARRQGCTAAERWISGPTGPGAVLAPSSDSKRFDSAAVTDPAILFDGGTYRLYYVGRSASSKQPGGKLGLATSADGQTWVAGAAALEIVGEDAPAVSGPSIIRHEGQYLMAYAREGLDRRQVAIAGSLDGVAWTRSGVAVLPGEGADWDSAEVSSPALAFFRHRLHLWYVGRGGDGLPSLGLATSDSGVLFTKEPRNPVLAPAVGRHDDRGVTDPWIILDGSVLHLWYVGLAWGGQTQINYARSQDGRNWSRSPSNPVIAAGAAGLFASELRAPTVLDRWGTLHLWFAGPDSSGRLAVGYAVNVAFPR